MALTMPVLTIYFLRSGIDKTLVAGDYGARQNRILLDFVTGVPGFKVALKDDLPLRGIRLDPQMFAATAMHLRGQYLDSDNNRGPSKDDCFHLLDSMSACGAFGLEEMRQRAIMLIPRGSVSIWRSCCCAFQRQES